MFNHKVTRFTAFSALALLAVTGCSAADTTTSESSASATASSSASSTSQVPLAVENAWVKASTSEMTGAFATITNTGKEAITIEGAQSDAAGMVQLHTTRIDPSTGTSTMSEKEGGFTLEPGQTLELAPGSDHIMLMDMSCSLVAGTTAPITLKTSAGDLQIEADVRDYSGAKEEYAPGEATSPAAETMETTGTEGHSAHAGHSNGESSAEATLPQCA